jgi:hypothetical protein
VAQIGAWEALAVGKQARRRAARGTPRTEVLGHVTSTRRGCPKQA